MPDNRRLSLVETYSEVAPLVHAQEDENRGRGGEAGSSSSSLSVFLHETKLFLELALPTTLLNLGTTVSPFLTASAIGRKLNDEVYLSAFTLANLTGNLCSMALLWGIFSASDTLSPQAFGKGDYPEVGYQAIRGVCLAAMFLIPINLLLVFYLEDWLIRLGQDPEAASHAMAWYRIFVLALPFVTVFTATWKFLSAQHVMMPLIYVSVFSSIVVLPVALEILTDWMGFLGSAVAYVLFQVVQTLLLFVYLYWKQPHTPQTWPNQWQKALQWKPLMEYLHLGSGGILAQSEWIFWEAMGLIIGKLGVMELSAHTIPNQVIMVACMAPFAFGIALAIRMGITLAADSVGKTKQMVVVTTVLSILLFGVLLTLAMYVCQDLIIAFFTNVPGVIVLAKRIWWKVCLFSSLVAVFGMLAGVAIGLGLQWTLGAVNFLFLWVFGVPGIYYATITLGGGLDAAWTWINFPYLMMNISLLVIFFLTDWHQVQDKILSGEIVQDPEVAPPVSSVVTPGTVTNATSIGAGTLSPLNPNTEKTGLLNQKGSDVPSAYSGV